MTVYYHREHFVEILRKWPDANRLLKSVDTDLTCEVYLAGVRALGIIDKIITALLWRLLESNVNIAEMGTHYKKLQLSFQEWQQDVSSMITGEAVFVTSNSRHFLRDTQILLMKSLNKFFKYFARLEIVFTKSAKNLSLGTRLTCRVILLGRLNLTPCCSQRPQHHFTS